MNKKAIAAIALVAALGTLSACSSKPAEKAESAPVVNTESKKVAAEVPPPLEPFKASVLKVLSALAELNAAGTAIDQNALNSATASETAFKLSAVLTGTGATFMADVDGAHCMVGVTDVKDPASDVTSAMCAATHADAMSDTNDDAMGTEDTTADDGSMEEDSASSEPNM